MSNSRAEYMRTYRARRKAAGGDAISGEDEAGMAMGLMAAHVADLEDNNRRLQETIVFLDEEIVRLKRELALRATPTDVLQPVVYQPTILPPTRPDDRPIGTFGAPRPAPKPAPRKR